MNYAQASSGREVGHGPSPAAQFTFTPSPVPLRRLLQLLPSTARWSATTFLGRGRGCHGRWLFAGTCTCFSFSSGQALSQRGSYQSWRLRDCPRRLGFCSRRRVWCVAVHKQQPAENTSPSGQWGRGNSNTSARKADAGRKSNKRMRHFSHFLHYVL